MCAVKRIKQARYFGVSPHKLRFVVVIKQATNTKQGFLRLAH